MPALDLGNWIVLAMAGGGMLVTWGAAAARLHGAEKRAKELAEAIDRLTLAVDALRERIAIAETLVRVYQGRRGVRRDGE
jgi:hypothetical protein